MDLGRKEEQAPVTSTTSTRINKPTTSHEPQAPTAIDKASVAGHDVEPEADRSTTSASSRTIYHVYHTRHRHYVITPVTIERKEKGLPTLEDLKNAAKRKRSGEFIDAAYFLHTPYISFHNPPRVLRRGGHKHAQPICLLHNSFLWRRWRLQFGNVLTQKGVLDPRGAISWEYASTAKEEAALKGYKVRTWRLWGESGKAYHQKVNEERRQETLHEEDPSKVDASGPVNVPKPDDSDVDSKAEEVQLEPILETVMLRWDSPFTSDTRRYFFRFGGIDFYWKGTGTVKQKGFWGFWVRYSHLKLVGQVPAESLVKETASSDASTMHIEVVLARYTCSPKHEKAGTLEIFDSVVRRYAQMDTSAGQALDEDLKDLEITESEAGELRKTRLYDLVMATTMCMVIGEFQKREAVKKFIELLVSEGGGNAGG